MSHENTKNYYYNLYQQYFLVLFSCKQCKRHNQSSKYRYNQEKIGKSRGSGIRWLLCGLFIKLLCVNRSEAVQITTSSNNIAVATSATATTLDITATKGTSTEIFIENNTQINKRGQHSSFSELEKEVVERLIKEWAPVVWLAPEEKFMPLGVEEFLANVHPESKDNSFTHATTLADGSEKSFLVTNIEIGELLQNKTSFIYGRNPNMSPVPIYAVVTLCNQNQSAFKQHSVPVVSSVRSTQSQQLKTIEATYTSRPSDSVGQEGFFSKAVEVPMPTRGPYIPITLGPPNQVNQNSRRSSRLYPMLHKIKRSISTPSASRHDLVMGESVQPFTENRLLTADPLKSATVAESEKVNNFIANLVDNVKFSVPMDEMDNSLEADTDFSYTEGTTIPSFHVTYWLFYPYSQGKNMCTLSLGPFGRIPFPAVYGYCLGRKKDIGSHIGDWEHMTLYFSGSAEPEAMYVSAHDAGAYYTYNRLTGSFEFKRQETRKGILQRPNFPKTVTTFNDHPVLFAAKGSHGLWTAPGKHRFVKVARLYDINGFGTPWNTWKHVQITYENFKSYGRAFTPSWLSFKGKWGNPKSKCHPLRRIGLNFCEFTDGPTGIPLKEPHFQCGSTFTR